MIKMAIFRSFSLKSLAYYFEESKFERALRMANIAKGATFPWSFTGIEEREPNVRYLADQMLAINKIQFSSLLFPLYNMYEKTLKGLDQMDVTPLKDEMEKSLYDSLNVLIGTMKQQGKSFRLDEGKSFEGKKPTVNITDALVYRGLSMDRSLNKQLRDYHIFFDSDIGVVCFTDLQLSDPLGYLDQDKMTKLHAVNKQTVLQILLSIKSNYILRVLQDGEDISEYRNYTFNQMCIFETQCEEPKKKVKEEKSESYLEWMRNFRPGKFILTDLNDFLGFNPLVRGKDQETK